jgi:hypothetical protein
MIQEMGPAPLFGTPEPLSIQRKYLINQLPQVFSVNISSLSHLLTCVHKPAAIIDRSPQEVAASTNFTWVMGQLSVLISDHAD